MAVLAHHTVARERRHRREFLAALLLALLPSTADAASPLEDAVRATYVYKFAPFVTWPGTTAGGSFTICVAGTDGVSALLPQAIAGQKFNGQPFVLRPIAADVPGDCRILYVAPSASSVLATLHTRPVLTIAGGETNDAIIRLIVLNHHVRFDIDAGRATGAGLSISSKLLSLARTVTPPASGDTAR